MVLISKAVGKSFNQMFMVKFMNTWTETTYVCDYEN